MSESEQPVRASLEFLKKLAKKRLAELREHNGDAKLADAQLIVAREHGFSSWRALKAEFDQRDVIESQPFFQLVAEGNVDRLRELLTMDARLANAADPASQRPNFTALHVAARANQLASLHMLLEFGANVHAREGMDNATALHFAANLGHVEIARALIDAGADVNDSADSHQFGPIGWASQFAPNRTAEQWSEMLDLLTARGARHHVYSAISIASMDVLRQALSEDASAISRRSPTIRMTPLAWAIQSRRFDMLPVLVQHGANLEEPNESGRTVMTEAILSGNIEPVKHLRALGAREPEKASESQIAQRRVDAAASVSRAVPMLAVNDIPATLAWYSALGFTEVGRYWEHNELRWATMTFGTARVMLSARRSAHHPPPRPDLKLWFYTTRIDEVHAVVQARQIETSYRLLDGTGELGELIEYAHDITDTPYGSREFWVRDLNGYTLYFIQNPRTDQLRTD